MKNFGKEPDTFSFKDLLAILFSATFLLVIWLCFFEFGKTSVLEYLTTPISIILGGYFVQEGIKGMRKP